MSSSVDPGAPDELTPLVQAELRRLAERRPATGPAELVHEAYLNLVGDATVARLGRARFLTVAARGVRRLLVEHARAADGNAGVTVGSEDIDVLALDEALGRLEEIDPPQARIVELRYFGGLTIEQAADTVSASPDVVAREWTVARAWLRRELAPEG